MHYQNTNITGKKQFLDEHFLLDTESAQELYHEYAALMPIIDYHNHLPPNQIASNHTFSTITEAWLAGDHYKWRAMRTNGINESLITGQASDIEKFRAWAATVPYTLRNPLYHWTHLELQRYFDIKDLLSEKNADEIFLHTNQMLNQSSHSVEGLLQMQNVKLVCTTDDPTDDLEHHALHASNKEAKVKMFPSFRPDKFILIEQANFNPFVDKLSQVVNRQISNYDEMMQALSERASYFKSLGCRASDHGLEYIPFVSFTKSEVDAIFIKARSNQSLTSIEIEKYKTCLLHDLGKLYHQLDWVMQLHLGALRNNNHRAMKTLGADTGWDSIGDWSQAKSLTLFLASLDQNDCLSKTVIYNLNPADNEVMATMIGNFNDGSIKGKIQFGSGWWFLDQKDGMEKQINALSNMGLLSRFIGMLTDSRSFLSFPRHEYFRRILCNLFGNEIENGQLPDDKAWVGKIIQDICFNNVKEYLDVDFST